MKAVVLKKTGKPSVLKVRDVPKPKINQDDEMLIRLKAAGINYAEILSRKGLYGWAPKRPYILGLEGAGIVEEVGSGVKTFKEGDKVIVAVQNGTHAEYITVTDKQALPAIEGFTMEENAAFSVSYMTAHVALREMARVRPKETILVQAAAGALGIATVQIAKALGLRVAGTASKQKKIDFLKKQLDIDLAINYKEQDFLDAINKWTNNLGVDCVLESVGGEVFRKSLKALAPFGRIIVVGLSSIRFNKWNPITWWHAWQTIPRVNILRMLGKSQGVMAFHLGRVYSKRRDVLERTWEDLMKMVKEHGLRPIIDSTYPLEQVAEAHRRIERRENIGKVVLTME